MLSKAYVEAIVILAPPMNIVYPFILDIEGYPRQIINFFVVIVGLHHFKFLFIQLWHRDSFGCVGSDRISPDHSRVE